MKRSLAKAGIITLFALRAVLPLGVDKVFAADIAPQPVAIVIAYSAESLLAQTNQSRARVGLPALKLNQSLTEAAEAKAADMITNKYWAHFRPSDQKAPWEFMQENGYRYTKAGENLARGFKTPAGITSAWVASPSHRANLYSTNFTEVGFACVKTVKEDGTTELITVQFFGTK